MEHTKHTPPSVEAPHGYIRFICNSCGASRDVPDKCSDRTCPSCFQKKGAKTRVKLSKVLHVQKPISNAKWCHIVLSTNSNEPLPIKIKQLVRAFTNLRRTPLWKKNCLGGFYSIEALKKDWGWHVHLHVVNLAYFVDIHALSAEWSRCCGRKSYIFSTLISTNDNMKNLGRVIYYVMKYATKDANIPIHHEREYNDAFRGRKVCCFYGIFVGLWSTFKGHKCISKCTKCGGTRWMPQFILDRLIQRHQNYSSGTSFKCNRLIHAG